MSPETRQIQATSKLVIWLCGLSALFAVLLVVFPVVDRSDAPEVLKVSLSLLVLAIVIAGGSVGGSLAFIVVGGHRYARRGAVAGGSVVVFALLAMCLIIAIDVYESRRPRRLDRNMGMTLKEQLQLQLKTSEEQNNNRSGDRERPRR